MPQPKPQTLVRTLAFHCAVCAGFGAGFAGALLALDVGGFGALVASAGEPVVVVAVLLAGMLSLQPLAFVSGASLSVPED
jgi:hypothetical protein